MNAGLNAFNNSDFPPVAGSSAGGQASGWKAKPREGFETLNQLPASLNAMDASLASTNFQATQQQHQLSDTFESNTLATPHNAMYDTLAGAGVGTAVGVSTVANPVAFDWQQAAIHRSQRWGQVQARSWFDSQWLDEKVQAMTKPAVGRTPARNMSTIFFNESSATKPLVGISEVGSKAYFQQIATKSTALKEAIGSGLKNPKSLLPVAGELAHASWTRSFTEMFAGNNVVSNGLSTIASGLFVFNASKKTVEAHDAAKADGQTDGQLATTTTIEGVKNFSKAGATWFMGDVGASVFKNIFGSEIKALEGTKFARFKSLPAQVAAIIGAVLFGTATQAGMEALLPTYQQKKAKEAQHTLPS
jgi:hypothetical protein